MSRLSLTRARVKQFDKRVPGMLLCTVVKNNIIYNMVAIVKANRSIQEKGASQPSLLSQLSITNFKLLLWKGMGRAWR